MPFIKMGMNVFKKLAGGWLTWIIVFLKNPLVISAIAFIAAFINVKIVQPIKKFWNTFVKPVFDKIAEIITPIIESIKDFFGDWIDYGIGPAFEILWETLKVRIPNLFKTVLLDTKILWYKFAYGKVLTAKNWVLKNWWDPMVRWYKRSIYVPVMKWVKELWLKFELLKLSILGALPDWMVDDKHIQKLNDDIIKLGKEVTAHDLYNHYIDLLDEKTKEEEEDKSGTLYAESLKQAKNLIEDYEIQLKRGFIQRKGDGSVPSLIEYYEQKLDTDEEGELSYNFTDVKRAFALQGLNTANIEYTNSSLRDYDLANNLEGIEDTLSELYEEQKLLDEEIKKDNAELSARLDKRRKELQQAKAEEEAKKKAEEEAKKKAKIPQINNTSPTLNETVINKEEAVANMVKETNNLTNSSKMSKDIATSVANSEAILNELSSINNNLNTISSNINKTPPNTAAIIMQNKNDNKPSPSYNGGSLWQNQY